MSENAHHWHPPEPPEHPREPEAPEQVAEPWRASAFSLEAYLDRQVELFAAGPTMADILRDMDRFREDDMVTRDDIVNALHEGRREREEQLEDLWKQ
ncbi:hypothetical protein [Saccharopolyspora sp. 5N708]|uniref:hypothetical protein n=1 Tax=Saccharopolyspora sp. 5N708 TaxID=3457424 RepID=UPI003FD56CE1